MNKHLFQIFCYIISIFYLRIIYSQEHKIIADDYITVYLEGLPSSNDSSICITIENISNRSIFFYDKIYYYCGEFLAIGIGLYSHLLFWYPKNYQFEILQLKVLKVGDKITIKKNCHARTLIFSFDYFTHEAYNNEKSIIIMRRTYDMNYRMIRKKIEIDE